LSYGGALEKVGLHESKYKTNLFFKQTFSISISISLNIFPRTTCLPRECSKMRKPPSLLPDLGGYKRKKKSNGRSRTSHRKHVEDG